MDISNFHNLLINFVFSKLKVHYIRLNKIKNVIIIPCAISNSKELRWIYMPKHEETFRLADK